MCKGRVLFAANDFATEKMVAGLSFVNGKVSTGLQDYYAPAVDTGFAASVAAVKAALDYI